MNLQSYELFMMYTKGEKKNLAHNYFLSVLISNLIKLLPAFIN